MTGEPQHPHTARARLLRWWVWLALFTTVAAILVAIRYTAVVEPPVSLPGQIFRPIMFFAHLGTLVLAALIPVLLAIAVWPNRTLVLALGTALSTLALSVLLVDTQIFQLYRFHLNAGVFNLLFGGAAAETFIFSAELYLQAALVFAGIIAWQTSVSWLAWRWVNRRRGIRIEGAIGGLFVALLLGYHSFHAWADGVGYSDIVEQDELFPVRHALTAKGLFKDLGITVHDAPVRLSKITDDSLAYPLKEMSCRRQDSPRNIIFIMIDSWRFDAMTPAITPNIHRFSDRTLQFAEHHSGGNATRVGVFSLFYAIPGTYWHSVLHANRPPVFFEELLKQGYQVEIFRSAPLFSPEFHRTVFAGLNHPRMRSDGAEPPDWDRDLTDDFLSFLKNGRDEKPFFAFLFYDSPHSFEVPSAGPLPFQPSLKDVNYLKLTRDSDPVPFRNRYYNSVHYVDSLVGEALTSIEAAGLLKNSLVLITSDHGQEFNDLGLNYWGHNSNYSRYQTGVPFLLYDPDRPARLYTHKSSHYDVIPTFMRDYLGCQNPFSEYSVGQDLYEPGGRDMLLKAGYSDFAIVEPDRITEVEPHDIDVVDLNYKPLKENAARPSAIRQALEQRSRFFERKVSPK